MATSTAVRGSARVPTAAAVAVLLVVVAVPLAVALAAVLDPTPHPLGELAETEMRVRDVPTGHPPLVGLPGRIGELARQGSHPGPLSFYAIWPTYRLLGESPDAFTAGGVVVHLAAVGVALWLAARRGGARMALGVAVLLAVLVGAYGGTLLTEPWNPNLPVLWWFTFLLAAWSVADRDLPALPVAVVAGSLCMQTHVSYVGVAGGVLLATAAVAVVQAVRQPAVRGRLVRWGAVALALGVVVWVPPVYEQVAEDRGNLSALVEHFTDPPEEAFGMGFAVDTVLDDLNVWNLVTRSGDEEPFAGGSSVLPGALLLAAWVASALTTWRLRDRRLGALHLVTGAALVAGTVSVSRIFGPPAAYLVHWLLGVTALVVLAVVATAVTAAGRLRPPSSARAVAGAATGALGAVLVVVTGVAATDARGTEVPRPELNTAFDAVVGRTVRALQAGDLPGSGPDGRYLVRVDGGPLSATLADGLVVALEREALRAGVTSEQVIRVRRSRVLPPGEATAEVRLATGAGLARWRAESAYREVAAGDPRSAAERRRFASLQRRAVDDLRQAGRADLAALVGAGDVAGALEDDRVPADARRALTEMQAMGEPLAVFVGPVAVPADG